jgi:hypothetical protein
MTKPVATHAAITIAAMLLVGCSEQPAGAQTQRAGPIVVEAGNLPFYITGKSGEHLNKFIKANVMIRKTANGVTYQIYYAYKTISWSRKGTPPDVTLRLVTPSGIDYLPPNTLRIPGYRLNTCTHNGPGNNYHAKDDLVGPLDVDLGDLEAANVKLVLQAPPSNQTDFENCGYPENP